jgi:starch synthase (maltosyl-transferring)
MSGPRGAEVTLPTECTVGRIVFEAITPEIDCGQFPIKRAIDEEVVVEADVFIDGSDVLTVVLCHRRQGAEQWREHPMESLGSDRWRAGFRCQEPGWYEYTVQAWVDRFSSWLRGLRRKAEAGQDVSSELLEGCELVREAAGRARGADAERLQSLAGELAGGRGQSDRLAAAFRPELATLMAYHPDRTTACSYDRVLRVEVERERARYGAWYELFPRSCSPEPSRHGTFQDAEARLPYIAEMGFDVLYLPPIHPIGRTARKGRNNTLQVEPGDPGSPWSIGGPEGGHKAVHPELGTLEDFEHFVAAAGNHGLEVALDIAFQCSPDHPYVREHPEWFRHGPDGAIRYAENPPKKYQDIYPLNLECEDWRSLWEELHNVVQFWIDCGIRIFRVDNPHTKPLRFWQWLIGKVRRQYPETIFLAEAFTRPKIMRYLARSGFSQSYTYFTWRNTRRELTDYLTELTQSEVREYLRANLFTNTPDILHEYLQCGGRPAFQIRLVLAATLGASYGIYGPAYELCVGEALPGTEEYRDSEKYQLRHWDLDAPESLRGFVAQVNRIRRENPALHFNHNLRFYPCDNDQIIFYGKAAPEGGNILFVVVNLDPHHEQSGRIHIPLGELQLSEDRSYQVHDLLTGVRYLWHGEWNEVRLDPQACPARIFCLGGAARTEQYLDYFL